MKKDRVLIKLQKDILERFHSFHDICKNLLCSSKTTFFKKMLGSQKPSRGCGLRVVRRVAGELSKIPLRRSVRPGLAAIGAVQAQLGADLR